MEFWGIKQQLYMMLYLYMLLKLLLKKRAVNDLSTRNIQWDILYLPHHQYQQRIPNNSDEGRD